MKKADIVAYVASEGAMTKRLGRCSHPRTSLQRASAGSPGPAGRPTGRNPRTGKRIAIGPSSGVSFKASKALKDALD